MQPFFKLHDERVKTQMFNPQTHSIMNYKNVKIALASLAILAFATTGCQKEMIAPLADDQTTQVLEDAYLTDLTVQADEDFKQAEVLGDGEVEGFSLNNDGLIDEYTLHAGSLDELGKRGNALMRCLASVGLDSTQKTQVRKALAIYEDCKKDAVASYRKDLVDLNKKIQDAREALVKKFRNNEITRDEFKTGMENLRTRYQKAAETIKASYARALNQCYEAFLKNLKRILSDRQWAAFTACLKKADKPNPPKKR